MKSIAAIILCFALFYSAQANAGMLSFGGESFITVADLPDTAEYQNENGENVDIGYLYKSITIFFVPIWNYDGRFVGVIEGNTSTYLNFEQQQIAQLVAGANLLLPEEPVLDFWNRVGGKIVFLLVVGYLVFSFYQKQQKKSQYLSDADTDEERLIDILQSSYNFNAIDLTQSTLTSEDCHIPPNHLLVGKVLTTCNIVSIFNVNQIEDGMTQATIDNYFDHLLDLKKSLKVKSQNTIQYFIFVSKQSPTAQVVEQALKSRKTKITKGANAFALIIDLESKVIHARKGMHPPKKALANCFVKRTETTVTSHTVI
jgi:hypothetical protein